MARIQNQPSYDLEGKRVAYLLALWPAFRRKNVTYWACQCECGTVCIKPRTNLKSGQAKSCGCKWFIPSRRIHGEGRHGHETPEFMAYNAAMARCNNSNAQNYKYYGGRGIQFKFTSYAEFLKEVGRRPSDRHSLDRIDNNGHYEMGNVRWATPEMQGSNRRPYGEWQVKA